MHWTISIGEILGIILTLGLAISANEEISKKCIVRMEEFILILENLNMDKFVISSRELGSTYASFVNNGMDRSTSFDNFFEFWFKEYLHGTMKNTSTAQMHLKKPILNHLYEIVKSRPLFYNNLEYNSELAFIRKELIKYTKKHYEIAINFNKTHGYTYKDLIDREMNIFLNKVNKINIFTKEISYDEINCLG